MNYTVNEVLQYVCENDVKFVRLAFCDMFGTQKNIAIMASELPRAFSDGISFDASAVEGFLNVEKSDLFLFPDPGTLAVLPWRPQTGRVVRLFCDIRFADKTPFAGDGRLVLKKAAEQAAALGYSVQIGSECEFYLFETDEKGKPAMIPFDNAGYLDIAPLDKCENIRREICLTLEEMDVIPEASHHEQGPGQNEIDFKYSDALAAADNLITFKNAVRTAAARSGLHASFMPKPFPDKSGSGLHVNMSLFKNGANLFTNNPGEHCREAESFIAGILNRAAEITLFLNPTTNSYKRLGQFEAPRYITWSHENRSQLIRIPAAHSEFARMELRSPDPSCNPYIAFALLIYAGLDGIHQLTPLPKPVNQNMYRADEETLRSVKALPADLGESIRLAGESDFVRRILPEATLSKYLAVKKAQWETYLAAEDQQAFEHDAYFRLL